ncbi:MAG: biopolymer transporter ExbD [Desulfuromonadaceae bacterium]|nr:biopolymer transporter ExbD [Desulfuromonadaceae bacterium]
MSWRRNQREEPRVELTPMIDVVFLLLIFFMISTTFVETPGLSIRLPESSSRVEEREARELKVYLNKDAEIFYQEQQRSLASLTEIFARKGREELKQMTFVLVADKEALHGRVVQLMDLAKLSGFGKLAIATDRAAPSN